MQAPAVCALLDSDAQFRAFHEGRVTRLPEFYHREYERMLGPYAQLLSPSERVPDLDAPAAPAARVAARR